MQTMKKLVLIICSALVLAACNQRDGNSGPAPENEIESYPPRADSITQYTDSLGVKDSGAHHGR